jgi:hypothetical protein
VPLPIACCGGFDEADTITSTIAVSTFAIKKNRIDAMGMCDEHVCRVDAAISQRSVMIFAEVALSRGILAKPGKTMPP